MKTMNFLGTTALAGALVLGLAATPAVAGAVADFYQGKRITFYVGSSPGAVSAASVNSAATILARKA